MKYVLVTGVSTGIGYSAAKELILKGYGVFGSVRKDSDAERLKSELGENVLQSIITEIIEDQSEPRLVFNPNHPDANETGYVAMPNVDLMTEMVNLVTSTRGFEANVTAMNATKSMAQRAIELGR